MAAFTAQIGETRIESCRLWIIGPALGMGHRDRVVTSRA